MNSKLKTILGLSALILAAQASAQITFYEGESFSGRRFTADGPVRNFDRNGFNDRVSSIMVERGRWEICQDARFGGRCVVLRRGSYDSLRDMGMNNRISSVRPAEESRRYRNEIPVPQVIVVPSQPHEYRRRESPPRVVVVPAPPHESRRREAPPQVVVVPAPPHESRRREAPPVVVPAPVVEQRRREAPPQVVVVPAPAPAVEQRRRPGETLFQAEVGTVRPVPGNPNQWDVTYVFQGREHNVRMNTPPGPSIRVNESGEPR